MTVIKTLWASVQGDPVFMRRVNGWLTIFWILMIPVSIVTGWISEVVYVSVLSLWALVSGHWSAWQAARVEVVQQEAMRKAEEDPVGEAWSRRSSRKRRSNPCPRRTPPPFSPAQERCDTPCLGWLASGFPLVDRVVERGW